MANEPQQHIEDVNSFGTDLPKRIKAKLTARQLLAQHALEPNQSIQFPFSVRDGDDDGASTMTVQEALGGSNQNFNGDADLSSRTPVARMWTAVRLIERTDAGWDPISNIKVYQLGNHILNTTSPDPTNDPIDPGSIDTQGLFPEPQQSQIIPNEFLAPPSGITSVTIRTPDPGNQESVAIEKFTTVTFVVNNIHDFNNIYSRYFLTHRAQVIVDVAWDTALLYNPHDIVKTMVDKKTKKTVPVITQLGRGDSIYKALFGRDNGEGQKDGYVIEANGDMDTIIGQVMEFNATYRPDGSIECTVQIHSANYDLMRYSFMTSDNPNDGTGKKLASRVDEIFQNKLKIAIEQTGYAVDSTTNEVNLPLGSLPAPKNTPPKIKKGILENGALRINKKVDKTSDAFTEGNVSERKQLMRGERTDFLSIGVIEDELLSIFGDFNSNGSFTKFDKDRYHSQDSETEPSELKLLYPEDWGILPKAKKFPSQGTPKSGDEAHTPWTKQQHIDSRQQLELGITRLHIYSDGSGQPQNNLESDPRLVRTSQVNPKAGPMPIDIRPERNPNKSVANGGNMIGTAPTDAEYTIIGYGGVYDDPWYKITFPWTGDSLAKAEETYLPRTVPKEIPDGGYEILLPRIAWDSMNAPIFYPEYEALGTEIGDTKPAQVRDGWFRPDTVTIPGTFDALLPGEKINENSYNAKQWSDGTVFNKGAQFVEGLVGQWDNTKTIFETMIDLPRLADYTESGGPDYRLYIDDAPGLGTGDIIIADSDIPGNPEIYWWRFETSQCYPGAYWGQDRKGGFPNQLEGWFYPRVFYRQIKSEVGLSIGETQEHVGEWKWSLDPRAPFPGGWVPITERVMQPNRIRVKDAGSGQMVDYDPKQQKVDGVPLTNWLSKEIVSDSEPYYTEWMRTRSVDLPRIIESSVGEFLGAAQQGYLRNEERIMVDRENYYIMHSLHQRTLIAKFESEEKSQTDPLLKSLAVPQPGPHQGWIHWTAGQPVDLPQEDVSTEESKDRVSYAWKKYPSDIKDDAMIERTGENWDGNEVKQRFRDALRGRTATTTPVEGDEAVQRLVPIRELFINTQVLKNAFSTATDLADALRRLLDVLNKDGSGAYHFRTAGNNQLATGVCIIDTEPTPVGPKNLNDLFVFSPYSPNSIIKNLNFQFQTPSDEVTEAQLGMAMMERGDGIGRILPVNEALDKYLTTNLLEQADILDGSAVQWWAPEMGSSNETFDPESEFLLSPTVPTSRTDEEKKSMDVLFGKSNSMGNPVPDTENLMVSTPDGEEVSFQRGQSLPNYASAGIIDKGTKDTSDDIGFTTGDSPYLPQHLRKQFELKNTKSVKDMTTKMEAFLGRSTPTPYNVTFDMYGIASEFGGRNFRMDFIPDRWFSRTYFRAYEQTQTITPETWTTSISAQMLTSNHFLQPPGKPTLGEAPSVYQDKRALTIDPNSEEFNVNPRWSELSKRLKELRIASHRTEHFSTGALLGGGLVEDLKDCTAPHLPPLTARWCSKYIGPNAPQWINDWVYGFYGAFYGIDGKLNVPKNPLKYPKGEWVAGTPEELGERSWGRGIPCTSDGRLALAPPGGRVTGAAGSGDTRYGVGPVSTVSALFDLRAKDLKGQRGINIPKDSKIRIVRYHEYWMVYPVEFPIPGKEPQTFQLDVSKIFSIFMEMTQPDKYK